ncbi:hypothetical protein [Aminobacter carboxidus]|uniref:CsbD family protein n=1 Tax=Aminobacter carboxidus TaxID=376165 RepID=A0ABR9GY27_9HYPH|nr:hypothetical protein [Aminobacter carboxidus]MBE1208429.1 hypothetical protein [Aminobacter carboxidus]
MTVRAKANQATGTMDTARKEHAKREAEEDKARDIVDEVKSDVGVVSRQVR